MSRPFSCPCGVPIQKLAHDHTTRLTFAPPAHAFYPSRTTFRPVPLEHSTLKRGGRGLASGAGLLVTCTRVVARVEARSTFVPVNPTVFVLAATRSPMSSFQPRKPAGSTQGGQFDTKPHAAIDMGDVISDARPIIAGQCFDNSEVGNWSYEPSIVHICSMRDSKLAGGWGGSTFIECDMNGAQCTQTDFSDSEISGTSLMNTSFTRGQSKKLALTNTHADGMRFTMMTSPDMQWTSVKGGYITIRGCEMYGLKALSCDLANMDIADTMMDHAGFDDTIIACATIHNVSMQDAEVRGGSANAMKVSDSDISQFALMNTTACDCTFTNTNVQNMYVKNTDMRRTSFEGECPAAGAQFIGSDLRGSNMHGMLFEEDDHAHIRDCNVDGLRLRRDQEERFTFTNCTGYIIWS